MDMPVCEHSVPVKVACWLCKRKENEERMMDEVEEGLGKLVLKIINFNCKTTDLMDIFSKTLLDLDKKYRSLQEKLEKKEKTSNTHNAAIETEILSKIHKLEKTLRNVSAIEDKAEEALSIFVRKAHDLKKMDAKRDDVINVLCQKIEAIDQRTRE